MNIISGLANEQVLQRLGKGCANAELQGNCTASGPILVTISGRKGALKGWKKRAMGTARGGKFRVKLAGIPAGGPYKLELQCGKETARVATFFVGDVWILAGQSNMEGVGNISGKSKPHPLVRVFSMRHVWRLATEPLHVLPESPDRCHNGAQCTEAEGEAFRQNAIKGTGVGLFFAREMVARTGVPQGLIATAHGGTSMSQWDPKSINPAESMYLSMLSSVRDTGQPAAGLLWYQGESDANPTDVPLYEKRMEELVAASRRDLKVAGLPWIIVQLSKVYGQTVNLAPWNGIQEIQRTLPRKIKNFETVPAIDLPMDDGIHIGADGYVTLAKRMAGVADRIVNANRRELPLPQPREARLVGTPQDCRVDVEFDHVVGGLQSVGPAHGFIFVSPTGDALSLIIRTVLKGNVARLFLNDPLPEGVRLTYGAGTSPICNITDGRGHAVPVFGPINLKGVRRDFCPFVRLWRVTGIFNDGTTLEHAEIPDFSRLETHPGTPLPNGFIQEYDRWKGKRGLAFFHARIELPEAMELQFLLGYDGPFRLWLDRDPFYIDLAGTNPGIADKYRKTTRLAAGVHDLHVGMDLNNGKAWGFFLRFARCDITPRQRKTGEFVKPLYLAPE